MDIENYNDNRGNYSPLVEHNGAAYGFWLIGRWHNTTKGKAYYYGAYPPSYLRRLELLFPKQFEGTILHLFSLPQFETPLTQTSWQAKILAASRSQTNNNKSQNPCPCRFAVSR